LTTVADVRTTAATETISHRRRLKREIAAERTLDLVGVALARMDQPYVATRGNPPRQVTYAEPPALVVLHFAKVVDTLLSAYRRTLGDEDDRPRRLR